MKASELRIGNLFIEDNSRKIISVIGLEENKIVFEGRFLENWQAKPIELREEILLKIECIEFKKNVPKSYYYKNRILIVKENGLIHDYASGVELPYLHTLQNFIFALTNEELKINL